MKVRMAPVQKGRKRTDVIEEKLVRHDGTVVDAEARGMPKSYKGKPAGLGMGSEETERKWAEDARHQRDFYETLLQAQSDVGEGLLVLEGERIRYANEAFCLISGYGAEELTSLSTIWELAAPDQRPVLYDRMRRRLRGEWVEDRYETTMFHKSGRRVELEVGVRLLRREGQLPHLVVVTREITARKQIEERLKSTLGVLVAVHEAAHVLNSTLNSKEIGARLLEILHRIFDFSATIVELRDAHGRASVLHARGPENLWRLASLAPEAQAARRKALETRERQPFRLGSLKGGDAPLAGLCLPLVVRDQIIGVLEAYGSEALAEEMTVETLESLSRQGASALENARLYQELAERERRLKDLVGKLIGAKEEERHRVAHEVHDGLTQVAIAAHQHLQAFAKDYSPDSTSSQSKLEGTLKLVRQTVREARSVIADLRPTALEDFGLAAALRSKVEALRADGWEIGYDEVLGGEPLPDEVETALYRVTQEALTNIRKHAQTTRAHITLARRGRSAYLEVRDWGRGFEQSTVPKVSGWGEQVGIYGMRERITLLGGDIAIRSRPGAGTRVVAEVPLPASERHKGVNGEHAG